MDSYLILWVIKGSPERQNEQNMCVYINIHIYTHIWGMGVGVCMKRNWEKSFKELTHTNAEEQV